MNRVLTVLSWSLLLAPIAYAQTDKTIQGHFFPPEKMWDVSDVRVKSIRRVAKSAALKNQPGIEIELVSPHPLYAGGEEWVLQVGAQCFQWPFRRPFEDGETLTYVLSMKDWKRLRDGDPLYLVWPGSVHSPFTYLNKKMVRKR